MSGGGVTYENEQEINDAIKEVRNDDNEINFCLIGYKDTTAPTILVLKAKGSGGVEELKQSLTDDNCYYGIVRVTEMIDKSLTVKFCYIKYLGSKCKTMFKAKLTTHTSPVQNKFKPHHVDITASELNELSQEIVEKLVSDASMSKSKEINRGSPSSSAPTPTSTPRGAVTGSPTPSSRVAPPKEGEAVDFEQIDSIKEAIKQVKSDSDAENWCLIGYVEDGSMKKIELKGKGTGSLDELKTHLKDDNVYYGLLRTEDKIDESVTIKFVFIHFIGNGLKPLHRAKISTHKGAVTKLFTPYHVDFTISEADELTMELVFKRVSETSGSGSKVLNKDGTTALSQKAASTSTAASSSPARNRNSVATTSSLAIVDEDSVKQAISNVRKDGSDVNYALVGYVENSRDKVGLIASGADLEDLKTHLKDDSAFYALVRVFETIDNSNTTKFVFIGYLGERTNPLLKAKTATHQGKIKDLLGQHHVSLFATTMDEISQEKLEELVSKASMSRANIK